MIPRRPGTTGHDGVLTGPATQHARVRPETPLLPAMDHIMRPSILLAIATLASATLAPQLWAQDAGTETEITFTEDKKEAARQQLRRLLADYDLDCWIFTREVRIDVGVDPHSHPILTLNTDFLDHDEMQLSIFLHEQAHWFVGESVPPRAPEGAAEVAIIRELRQRYPDAPIPDYNAYLHLIVAWVELDAMAELVGEERARRLLREKVRRIVGDPPSRADTRYRWYNTRVLEDTQGIGTILARHGMVITPDKGLPVQTDDGQVD